ncbi:SpoIIE family protein phosphatase [Streptomyces sp. RKAG337]|nr:GAF domain-containing SpoIIE family protein phosphatase [Streptomyces sp. RKAG337]MCM2425111.1 SpoIIE family protein phosphatase [Streptomyces sp. RKAG337]
MEQPTLVIPDTLADLVACANPLVAGALQLRFYAAAPIITADGHRLGTVNILDTRPRLMTEADTAALADLAAIVRDSLELRLSALRLLREEQARHKEQQETRERAERDMAGITAFATALQRTLLPPALPTIAGLELACHYQTDSPRDVGGDFYDVFPLGADRWAFFLGDVCGKGAEAAAVTSLTRYTLREAAQHHTDPQTVLSALNSALLADPSVGSRFCTCVFGVLNRAAEGGFTITVATGGHPPLFHLMQTTPNGAVQVQAVHPEGGMLVGAFPDAQFASQTLHLAPGHTLRLSTDGLTEARITDRTMLGEDGPTTFLSGRTGTISATTLVNDTIDLLHDLPRGAGDDVALLALSVPRNPTTPGPAAPTTATLTPHPHRKPARSPEPAGPPRTTSNARHLAE